MLRHRGGNFCILHSAQHPLFVELWLHLQVRLDFPDAAPAAHQCHGVPRSCAVRKVDDHARLVLRDGHDLGAILRRCLAVRRDDVGQLIPAKQDRGRVVDGDHDIAASGHDGRHGREVCGVVAQGLLQLRADLAERSHADVLEVDVAAVVGRQRAGALVHRGRQAPLLRTEREGRTRGPAADDGDAEGALGRGGRVREGRTGEGPEPLGGGPAAAAPERRAQRQSQRQSHNLRHVGAPGARAHPQRPGP
mmetsp:Transcript_64851/g.203142  ORF Transcript_64851/g.203142 Transcript_64851/m.203142 type:complete len:249 (-) Transcript_64851:41-787(-)